jgi:hypothetical protein
MDGSKRSAHANAYFTGLGAAKRVVFFDTLLSRLSPGEVEAVLAHELGHFKHRHVLKRMVAIFAASLAGLALLGWLSGRAASTLGWAWRRTWRPPTTRWRCCCSCWRCRRSCSSSRRWHGAPVAAARVRGRRLRLPSGRRARPGHALLKLHEDNAATLTPDPLYVRFYYSHPPASERLAALRGRSPHDPAVPAAMPARHRRSADRAEVTTLLAEVPGWAVVDGALQRASRSPTTHACCPSSTRWAGWHSTRTTTPTCPQLGPLHGALAHALGGRLSINDFICAARVDALLP